MVDEHQLLLGRVLRQQPQQCGLLRAGADGAGAVQQRGPARVAGVAFDEAGDRGGGGARRRSGRGQQMLQRQAMGA